MSVLKSKVLKTVSVRDLVEFVLRRGDLGGKREFVGRDRALEGIRGHQRIQRSRPPDYQTEITVEQEVKAEEFVLRIRGRIDGLLVRSHEILLEEIKTVLGRWDGTSDPLHWAQTKFYGYLYASQNGLRELVLQLTYLELATGKVTEARQVYTLAELTDFFEATTAIYMDWLRERHKSSVERNRSIGALAFPFTAYRAGQHELVEATYQVLVRGGRLFLAAPTGIGKTMAVLFPAIKALGEAKLERIFYLTARTVGRGVAEKALADLRRNGLHLSAVTLTAREKVCVRQGKPCEMATCPMALGYYDRVKSALREALAREELTREVLESVAQKHQVCPFELALDVSVWADAIICDYNYVFDPQVYLRRHFEDEPGEYGLLVDEAHNLVDRAREMYSAELDGEELRAAIRLTRPYVPRLARALTELHGGMQGLSNSAGPLEDTVAVSDVATELNLFPAQAKPLTEERAETEVSREFPEVLTELLEAALAETESWLAQNQETEFREDLLALFFRMHTFRRTADRYDGRFVTLIEKTETVKVRLFCLDPSDLLRQACGRGKATIFFSATLTPVDYYRTLLGGAPDDAVLQLPSPFPSQNLAVLIQDRIETHLKARATSLSEVVTAIGTFIEGKPGNYLVYLPSYHYLNAVRQEFEVRYPTVAVLTQRTGMTEAERDAFLAAFAVEHGETLAGFAVLGGIFGEGIDLVGERLIGAVIVGVGMPQLCVERDLIRDYFQQLNGRGFDYAYSFPGMNRVLQAVGRVIRSETDRGVVLLIDARFGELRYRRLFPPWWKFVRVRNPESLSTTLAGFWDQG
ncbi:MAG: excision repair protein [Verrucomicrobiota bacterium]